MIKIRTGTVAAVVRLNLAEVVNGIRNMRYGMKKTMKGKKMIDLAEELRDVAFECEQIPEGFCGSCQTMFDSAELIEHQRAEIAYLRTRVAWHEGVIRG